MKTYIKQIKNFKIVETENEYPVLKRKYAITVLKVFRNIDTFVSYLDVMRKVKIVEGIEDVKKEIDVRILMLKLKESKLIDYNNPSPKTKSIKKEKLVDTKTYIDEISEKISDEFKNELIELVSSKSFSKTDLLNKCNRTRLRAGTTLYNDVEIILNSGYFTKEGKGENIKYVFSN